jgi:hypothetical protein
MEVRHPCREKSRARQKGEGWEVQRRHRELYTRRRPASIRDAAEFVPTIPAPQWMSSDKTI